MKFYINQWKKILLMIFTTKLQVTGQKEYNMKENIK